MTPEPAGAPPAGRFAMRPYWLLLGLIALLGLAPPVLGLLGASLAEKSACAPGAEGPTACNGLIAGLLDLGGMTEVTTPVASLLGLVWVVTVGISVLAWRRKRSGVGDATKLEVNFGYYGLALLAIVLTGYATLNGWLPGPALLLVLFAAIFWIFSFAFALLSVLRDSRTKAK
jgi:type IV secretory pathway VirB2 component (pilin)